MARPPQSAARIVLTGGPGAGKTTVAHALAGLYPDRFVCVPEAATQVYTHLATRWDRLTTEQQFDVQRRIYHTQIEQEDRLAAEHPGKSLLLDRGTLDGACYWPTGVEAYWQDIGTNLTRELARYDRVVWLQTAAAIGLYDGDASNTTRFEDARGAIEAGERLVALWSHHPRFDRVPAFPTPAEKLETVERLLIEPA